MHNQNELTKQVERAKGRLRLYSYMLSICLCPIQRLCYTKAVEWEAASLRRLKSWGSETPHRQKVFTVDELANYDGSGGRPAYVAVDGKVYDVSINNAWGGGTHFGLYAGEDVSIAFAGCHKSKAAIEKLPMIGILSK